MKKLTNLINHVLNTPKIIGRIIVAVLIFAELSIVPDLFNKNADLGMIAITIFVIIDIIFWFWYENQLIRNLIFASTFTITLGVLTTVAITSVLINGNPNPSDLPVIMAGNWIGFAGSIIGGIMTTIAVLYTINHAESARQSDFEHRIMPLVDITVDLDFTGNLEKDALLVTNISDNPLRDLELCDPILYINGKSFDVVMKTDHRINFLKGKDCLKLRLSGVNDYLNKLTDSDEVEIASCLSYFDMYGKKKYTVEFDFGLSISKKGKRLSKKSVLIDYVHIVFEPDEKVRIQKLIQLVKDVFRRRRKK